MGCDIHAFVEYKKKKAEINFSQSFGSEFHLDRNYAMFGILAGVRSDDEPVVSPRGLPEDLAYIAKDRAFLFIDDKYADESGF